MLSGPGTRGFTLVEALVALAIMLAGLAGAGIVLLQSVQQERESSHRRTAIRMAGSFADELRARIGDESPPLEPDSPAILAWIAAVQAALPDGTEASVDVDAAMPATYTIRIAWPVAGVGMQRLALPVTP